MSCRQHVSLSFLKEISYSEVSSDLLAAPLWSTVVSMWFNAHLITLNRLMTCKQGKGTVAGSYLWWQPARLNAWPRNQWASFPVRKSMSVCVCVSAWPQSKIDVVCKPLVICISVKWPELHIQAFALPHCLLMCVFRVPLLVCVCVCVCESSCFFVSTSYPLSLCVCVCAWGGCSSLGFIVPDSSHSNNNMSFLNGRGCLKSTCSPERTLDQSVWSVLPIE